MLRIRRAILARSACLQQTTKRPAPLEEPALWHCERRARVKPGYFAWCTVICVQGSSQPLAVQVSTQARCMSRSMA